MRTRSSIASFSRLSRSVSRIAPLPSERGRAWFDTSSTKNRTSAEPGTPDCSARTTLSHSAVPGSSSTFALSSNCSLRLRRRAFERGLGSHRPITSASTATERTRSVRAAGAQVSSLTDSLIEAERRWGDDSAVRGVSATELPATSADLLISCTSATACTPTSNVPTVAPVASIRLIAVPSKRSRPDSRSDSRFTKPSATSPPPSGCTSRNEKKTSESPFSGVRRARAIINQAELCCGTGRCAT